MNPFRVDAVGRSDIGLRRGNNEDSFLVGEQVLVVADGVGGAAAGELAATTVTDAFAAARRPADADDIYRLLTDCIRRGTDAIAELVRGNPELEGMATTVTALMWAAGRIVVAQVGDSRAYFLPGRGPRELAQITRDDSFVQYLVDRGLITAEQALTDPRRNVIVQALNGMSVTPGFVSMAPVAGDRYLLCSDGLSDYVGSAAIEGALKANGSRADAADALIALALAAGAPDNVTVIVADVVPA